jgi:hypothetical protein
MRVIGFMKRTIILVLYFFINIALCFANEVSVWTDENGQTKVKSSYESGIVDKYQPSDVNEIFVWEDEKGQTQWSHQQPKDWDKFKDKNAKDFVNVSAGTETQIDIPQRLYDLYAQCGIILQTPPSNSAQCQVLCKLRDDINTIVNGLNNEKLQTINSSLNNDINVYLNLCSQIKSVSREPSRTTGGTQVQINIKVPIPKAGEFYPSAGGGAINPKTGEFYPSAGGGVINPGR